ncbi:MAG: hypothetical protein JXQ73_05890 [Phycisphaerae bacterium]|nr:hypothetical protein [Phycisphaerae bacterium]
MRRRGWTAFGLGVVILTAGGASAADAGKLVPKVTDVAVFKDGHALVMAKGRASLAEGWCETTEVPVPVLGTFWAFAGRDEARVDFVSAVLEDKDGHRPCRDVREVLQANGGRRVRIVEHLGQGELVTHEGVLVDMPASDAVPEQEIKASGSVTPCHLSSRLAAPMGGAKDHGRDRPLPSYVLLKTDGGTHLIDPQRIQGICFPNESPIVQTSERQQVRTIRLRVLERGRPLAGGCDVGFVYLQRGIRWIPSYRIELLGEGRARVGLQASVVNDLIDLVDADLRLVVGVPTFLFSDQRSPVGLSDRWPNLSECFAVARPDDHLRASRRGERVNLSNAVMSQVSGAAMGDVDAGQEMPFEGEGQLEDLFLYERPKVTLKKGGRAVIGLLDAEVAYEDVYTLDVPVEVKGLINVMHEIRLTNSSDKPWTTGPAMVLREGSILCQQMLKYTSRKNKVDLPITVATDVNAQRKEVETGREMNVRIGHRQYTRVSLHGTLTITNFKQRVVKVFVTRRVRGTASQASGGGKIEMEDLDAHNPLSKITWELRIEPGKTATLEYDWQCFQG